MRKYFFVIMLLAILYGCKKESEIKKEDTGKTAAKTDTRKEAKATDVYEGVYTTNKHESTFIDCSNSNSIYSVLDETGSLEGKYGKMFETPSVYNSVVVKIKGEIEETGNVTIAEKYPKTLRVKEVISVEKKNFSNTCLPYDFWAFGNEPSWSLQISEKENLIEFTLPAEGKSYYFFYSDASIENGDIVYRNHNQIQRYLIEIKFRKGPCSDEKSGKTYEYIAEVELSDKRKFKGCAIKGKVE